MSETEEATFDWRQQLMKLHAEMSNDDMTPRKTPRLKSTAWGAIVEHRLVFGGHNRDPEDPALAEIARLKRKLRNASRHVTAERETAAELVGLMAQDKYETMLHLVRAERQRRYEARAKGHVIGQAKKWAKLARAERDRRVSLALWAVALAPCIVCLALMVGYIVGAR